MPCASCRAAIPKGRSHSSYLMAGDGWAQLVSESAVGTLRARGRACHGAATGSLHLPSLSGLTGLCHPSLRVATGLVWLVHGQGHQERCAAALCPLQSFSPPSLGRKHALSLCFYPATPDWRGQAACAGKVLPVLHKRRDARTSFPVRPQDGSRLVPTAPRKSPTQLPGPLRLLPAPSCVPFSLKGPALSSLAQRPGGLGCISWSRRWTAGEEGGSPPTYL